MTGVHRQNSVRVGEISRCDRPPGADLLLGGGYRHHLQLGLPLGRRRRASFTVYAPLCHQMFRYRWSGSCSKPWSYTAASPICTVQGTTVLGPDINPHLVHFRNTLAVFGSHQMDDAPSPSDHSIFGENIDPSSRNDRTVMPANCIKTKIPCHHVLDDKPKLINVPRKHEVGLPWLKSCVTIPRASTKIPPFPRVCVQLP